jgi:WhiB family transcriptional regulator, redox-sensing transcriptional regulator
MPSGMLRGGQRKEDYAMSRQGWRDNALCQKVSTSVNFFPEQNEDQMPAKRVCYACPVRRACLDWALSVGEGYASGVLGGFSERERRKMRRSKRVDPSVEFI